MPLRRLEPTARHCWDGRDVVECEFAGVHLFLDRAPEPPADRHFLAKHAAAYVTGQPSALLGREPLGRPLIAAHPDWGVSLSRAAGATLVALAKHCRIGVDIETRARLAAVATVADRWLSPAERQACSSAWNQAEALACHWVLKEALGKAKGIGLPPDPAAWSFDIGPPIHLSDRACRDARFELALYDEHVIGLARLAPA